MTLPIRWRQVVPGFPTPHERFAILEPENEVRPGKYELPEDVLAALLVEAGYSPEQERGSSDND